MKRLEDNLKYIGIQNSILYKIRHVTNSREVYQNKEEKYFNLLCFTAFYVEICLAS
jgi:hypothetical protein